MKRRVNLAVVLAMAAALMLAVAVPAASAATGTVSQDQTAFANSTGASPIAWVGSTSTDLNNALPIHQPWPMYGSNSCIAGALTTPGGEVTVRNAVNPSGQICYIGPDWTAGLANTNPTPRAATIVISGEDDYTVAVVLAVPVKAIGFSLLTNSTANETITLTYTDNTTETFNDGVLGTLPNQFEFVGFSATKGIKSILLNTSGGASQNEGIERIWLETDTDDDGVGDSVDNCPTISNPTQDKVYSVDFLPPLDDSTLTTEVINKMKNGRVVPVKVSLYDECAGALVTDPSTVVTIDLPKTAVEGGGTDPVESYADAGSSSAGTDLFRWSADGFWIYNLDSKALGLIVDNAYRVDVFVGGTKATTATWAVLKPVK